MKPNSGLVMTFFFSGLLLVGVGLLISKWMDADSPTSPTLAQVEKVTDSVFILKKHLTQKETIFKKTSLHALESLETSGDGEAILDFPSAYRLHIFPNSQLTLDQEGDATVVYLKAGEIKIVSQGREGTLFIAKGGLRWSATDYESLHPSMHATDPALPSTDSQATEGLTPSYIVDTLKSQKGIFYKCYTQLLQKNPGVVGETSISMTIEPNGKISRSDVTSSQMNDASFKKCLIEATARIEFKPFRGDAITTVFPLKFE